MGIKILHRNRGIAATKQPKDETLHCRRKGFVGGGGATVSKAISGERNGRKRGRFSEKSSAMPETREPEERNGFAFEVEEREREREEEYLEEERVRK